MSSEKILIIEDEKKIARLIQLELEHEGYETDAAWTGTEGLEKFKSTKWDLVLLDVMLPGLSGMEVLRRIRALGNYTPIILLTARDSLPDKVSGLDLGANDYMTKPFEIEELLARIRACLRMNQFYADKQDDELHFLGELTVNEKTREVLRDSQPIELTPREFDLLVYLLQHKNQVLNREQILSKVWGFDYYGDTNIVDVYIRYLRKKIDSSFSSPYIHTIRGVGYTMKE
ncbi:response regulator transcription factor [Metabacillus arenae]|uniref:Response regulator transcription factor n=1 Tax=Metabacillus arenae TaxID=2771434 RepID=A0A926S0Q9_9BACI|nr:response regulator transcription factor [Metabacillus arenae]MBD1383552.1 response regulator transcription factor [Metabacillus arenae]